MSMPSIFMDVLFEKYFNFKSLRTQFFFFKQYSTEVEGDLWELQVWIKWQWERANEITGNLTNQFQIWKQSLNWKLLLILFKSLC